MLSPACTEQPVPCQDSLALASNSRASWEAGKGGQRRTGTWNAQRADCRCCGNRHRTRWPRQERQHPDSALATDFSTINALGTRRSARDRVLSTHPGLRSGFLEDAANWIETDLWAGCGLPKQRPLCQSRPLGTQLPSPLFWRPLPQSPPKSWGYSRW